MEGDLHATLTFSLNLGRNGLSSQVLFLGSSTLWCLEVSRLQFLKSTVRKSIGRPKGASELESVLRQQPNGFSDLLCKTGSG
jgi:hypothetical protein